jgi:hypothetical protein
MIRGGIRLPPQLRGAKNMPVYMVSYDIAEQDRKEYEPLWNYLRFIEGRKALYSQWVVKHQGPATALLNEIKSKVTLKNEDGLIVQRITGDTASSGKLQMAELAFSVLIEGISRG